jgi:hypothetical protein
MPGATLDPENPERVLIAGQRRRFSDEVADVLLEAIRPALSEAAGTHPCTFGPGHFR